MVMWNGSNNEKSSSSNNEKANMCLIADIDEKVEVKTYFESKTFSTTSLDEEEMSYDVLLQNFHMISFECKTIKKNIKYLFLKIMS